MTAAPREIHPALPAGAVDALKSTVLGTVVTPDDSEYDAARTVWNAMIDRRPALIVRCKGTADVIDAVRFAHKHVLPVSPSPTGA